MKTPTCLSITIVSLGLTFTALPNVASAFSIAQVTQVQLDGLQVGESSTDIINTLGTPEDSPKWMNGTRSLVYEIQTDEGAQRAFVDIDSDGKMISVEVLTP